MGLKCLPRKGITGRVSGLVVSGFLLHSFQEGAFMPRMTDKMIDSGDPFPGLEVDQVGGGKISLPGDLAGDWGVVLLYRGHW